MSDRQYLSINVDSLFTGYGKKQVINGVTLNVEGGEIVALIGHNGAGKSTLLKAIYGLIPVWKGQVFLNGNPLRPPDPRNLLLAGVAYVPQGNRVFADLTVAENLQVCSSVLPDKSSVSNGIESILNIFPTLKAKLRQKAGTLSGGEKQILSLSNALVSSPKMLLLDEPSLGLAPHLSAESFGHIQEINRVYGTTILIVEQKVREVLKLAERVYVLRNGLVTFSGPVEYLDEKKLREVYL